MKALILTTTIFVAACSAEAPHHSWALQLDVPTTERRDVMVTVEETEIQTNVLVDEPDLRLAVVVPKTDETDPAVGIWRPGTDFLVCKAIVERSANVVTFDGPCAMGVVMLPEN